MSIFKIKMIGNFLVLAFAVITSIYTVVASRIQLAPKLFSLLVLVLALFLLFQRDTYLPFLGPAAFPVGLLKEDMVPKGANVEVKIPIEAKDGDRVLYWGAMPGNTVVATPWAAYGKYENSGIATVKDGHVVLRFHCPTKYKVPYGKTLDRHVHYRVCCEPTGMLGRVETTQVNC